MLTILIKVFGVQITAEYLLEEIQPSWPMKSELVKVCVCSIDRRKITLSFC